MGLYQFKKSATFFTYQAEKYYDMQGYQGKLAKAAHCHSSHISQVIRKKSQLTLDQAAGIACFWELDPNETEYWLTLIQYEIHSTHLC